MYANINAYHIPMYSSTRSTGVFVSTTAAQRISEDTHTKAIMNDD